MLLMQLCKSVLTKSSHCCVDAFIDYDSFIKGFSRKTAVKCFNLATKQQLFSTSAITSFAISKRQHCSKRKRSGNQPPIKISLANYRIINLLEVSILSSRKQGHMYRRHGNRNLPCPFRMHSRLQGGILFLREHCAYKPGFEALQPARSGRRQYVRN